MSWAADNRATIKKPGDRATIREFRKNDNINIRQLLPAGVGWTVFYCVVVIPIAVLVSSQLWITFIVIPSLLGAGNSRFFSYLLGFIITPLYVYAMWKIFLS